ncbi:ABC transporter permease [Pseudoroseicyclus sp. H15]
MSTTTDTPQGRRPFHRLIPRGLLLSIAAVVVGVACCAVLIFALADEPVIAVTSFVFGTFSNTYNFGTMIAIATVLSLTAFAATSAFRAGAFNIGVEGQLVLGGLAAAVVAPASGVGGIGGQAIALGAAALAGGLWIAIPAFLRVRFRTNEILTTLMFNYIAAELALFLVNAYFRDPTSGAVETPRLERDLWLTRILPPSAANVAIFLVILLAIAMWLFFDRTRTGKRMEVVGLQPAFAEYLGIRSERVLFWAMVASGALAGLGGGVAILGISHSYISGFSPEYGFLGLTVALIGRLKPIGILAAAVLYGTLVTGATVMQATSDVPYALVFILQAVLILLITSKRFGG